MDKSVIAGGFLCFIADLFAIASLATPEWIVSKFAGKLKCQMPRNLEILNWKPGAPWTLQKHKIKKKNEKEKKNNNEKNNKKI